MCLETPTSNLFIIAQDNTKTNLKKKLCVQITLIDLRAGLLSCFKRLCTLTSG